MLPPWDTIIMSENKGQVNFSKAHWNLLLWFMIEMNATSCVSQVGFDPFCVYGFLKGNSLASNCQPMQLIKFCCIKNHKIDFNSFIWLPGCLPSKSNWGYYWLFQQQSYLDPIFCCINLQWKHFLMLINLHHRHPWIV